MVIAALEEHRRRAMTLYGDNKKVQMLLDEVSEEIKAYKNNGSYYLLKDKDKGYAIVGRGFRRVGNWYKTEEEAHRVWRASKQ